MNFDRVTLLPLCQRISCHFCVFRRLTSKEAGYVPANYIKEIEPRTVKKTTKQKVMVPEKVKVKRKVKKKVMIQKQRPVSLQVPTKKGWCYPKVPIVAAILVSFGTGVGLVTLGGRGVLFGDQTS